MRLMAVAEALRMVVALQEAEGLMAVALAEARGT